MSYAALAVLALGEHYYGHIPARPGPIAWSLDPRTAGRAQRKSIQTVFSCPILVS